jgi:hypothetical protein
LTQSAQDIPLWWPFALAVLVFLTACIWRIARNRDHDRDQFPRS